MLNILIKKLLDDEDIKIIKDNYDVNIILAEEHEYPPQEILNTIEVFFGWSLKNPKKIMPNLKWIHLYSAGVDYPIVELRKEKSPPRLTNNSGAYGVQLSEHSLALVLALNKRIPKFVKDTQDGIWDSTNYDTGEIYGTTVGIVGFGDVGKHSAKIFNALGAKVYANKLNRIVKPDYVEDIFYGSDGLNIMLGLCDYVIITLPGTEKTRNLFDRDRMLKIKKGAILTNVGRGYVIDCDALADLLNTRHLKGAGLDVTNPEPLPEGHKLWSAENIIITPHISGPSPSKSARSRVVFENNLKAYLKGERMPTEIDFDKGY